jgi:ABC-type transport system substrate-binding protein
MPRPGCPEFPQLVEAVAGYWEKIGLKPKIRMTEWNVFRVALRERKSQNTIHGVDSFITPNVGSLSVKFGDKFYFRNSESTVNIPEVNEKFDRIVKSMDISEISKLLSEIYRYGYDQYLMIPIAEINDLVATTKRIPKWDLGSHENDRNYNDLIREQKTGKN